MVVLGPIGLSIEPSARASGHHEHQATYLSKCPHCGRATLAELVCHWKPREIDPQPVHEAGLVRAVAKRMALRDPETLHRGPVRYYNGPLIAEHALEDAASDPRAPCREDAGIVFAFSPTERKKMADEWEGMRQFRDTLDARVVGAVCCSLW